MKNFLVFLDRSWKDFKIEIGSTIQNGEVFVNWANYIELAYRSNTPIIKIEILLSWEKVWEISINRKKSWTYKGNINIPFSYNWKNNITIRAVDYMYYSNEETKEIIITKKDKKPPELKITNPIDYNIKLYKWQNFNLRWKVGGRTAIKSINIYINWKPLKIWLKNRDFVYSITSENLKIWNHKIKIEAIDTKFNISTKEVNLEIIKQ